MGIGELRESLLILDFSIIKRDCCYFEWIRRYWIHKSSDQYWWAFKKETSNTHFLRGWIIKYPFCINFTAWISIVRQDSIFDNVFSSGNCNSASIFRETFRIRKYLEIIGWGPLYLLSPLPWIIIKERYLCLCTISMQDYQHIFAIPKR